MVAEEAIKRIILIAKDAIAKRGRFRLVLAGGNTPKLAYQLLATQYKNFHYWEIFFGDERCLPIDHKDRNSRMASDAWLQYFDFLAIHPIPAELGAESAKIHYQTVIKTARPFDLVLLGLGDDGHTASLFPERNYHKEALVLAVDNAPKPPSQRVSLGLTALSNSYHVLFMVTGENKQTAIKQWQTGINIPASQVSALTDLTVLVDDKAWIDN